MSFKDVKKFCMRLIIDLHKLLLGEELDEDSFPSKNKLDDDELSNIIAKKLVINTKLTKIIVIDEIDTFETYQSSFLTMVKSILAS
jgi:nucleoside-triphosphatase THEP1